MLARHKCCDPESCGVSRGESDSITPGTPEILLQLQNDPVCAPNSYFIPEALRFAQGTISQSWKAQGKAEGLRVSASLTFCFTAMPGPDKPGPYLARGP